MPGLPGADDRLIEVLEEARRRRHLGPGAVEAQITHARAFARHWPTLPQPIEGSIEGEGPFLDLGSGGGIPGLVLALDRPCSSWVLLDANTAKAAFLTSAAEALGLADRVTVITTRAEEAARDPTHRERYASVVARSFARPAIVAECASPLLQVGGLLLVSEPPEDRRRWSIPGLEELGLQMRECDATLPPRIAVLRQQRPCPDRFPRRVGIPAKRPLW